MDDPFDNGVEVEDAIGLAVAFRQLHEAFQSRKLTDLDRQHPSYVGYSNYPHEEPFYGGDAAKEDWLRRCVQSNLAEETIKRALQCGELHVYFITKNQMPARLHRREFGRSNWASGNTIKGGQYNNANGSNKIGSPYHGAYLWVKNADWNDFLARLTGSGTVPQMPTGDPGRPSMGYQLYYAKFKKRMAQRECALKLADEARSLLVWFKSAHPSAQCPTQKTITNRIRDDFNRYKNSL
jgi:hypothetical protein